MDNLHDTRGRLANELELSVGNDANVGCVSTVADTELVLLANRTAWWPAEKILLLADSHFGKAATFRKAGLPVPMGTTARMLDVLSAAVTSLQPARLVILGDFVHSITPARLDFERELSEWRKSHFSLPITLILGNHDRHRDQLFRQLRLDVRDGEVCGPFHFCHDPFAQRAKRTDGFLLGGHIHPGIRLGGEAQCLPCFWQGDNFLVFPAFGVFTGIARIWPSHRDFAFPISGGQIARVSANDAIAPPLKRRTGLK